MTVEGQKELSDTFTVGRGIVLTLPGIGDVPLTGVLRSELRAYLTRRLAQNLRAPVVRASAYVRLSVHGAVARPAFYGVSADALLSDAVVAGAVAGGLE
jgi:protein involved in polysaccharide export with SLBB domain